MIPKATRTPAARGRGARRRLKEQPKRRDNAWQLPSGEKLAEFALASGFLAPPLMENARLNRQGKNSL